MEKYDSDDLEGAYIELKALGSYTEASSMVSKINDEMESKYLTALCFSMMR